MGLFSRIFGRSSGRVRGASSADTAHLRDWAARRRGVEGYLEPRTLMTETTLLLIAHDGEWTRRRIASPHAAGRFTRQLGIPLYEVTKVGYPQRMRDYQARQRILRTRAQRAADECAGK